MENRVTIVVLDSSVAVDGESLIFDFTPPVNVHAVQWRNGTGHIEYMDETRNLIITGQADYDLYVAPYVVLWQAEKARIDEENAPIPPTEEERYNAERRVVDIKYSAPWSGISGGVLTVLQMTMTAALCEVPQDAAKIASIGEQYQTELAAMAAELAAIDQKYGV